jgi:hypothetical protein
MGESHYRPKIKVSQNSFGLLVLSLLQQPHWAEHLYLQTQALAISSISHAHHTGTAQCYFPSSGKGERPNSRVSDG